MGVGMSPSAAHRAQTEPSWLLTTGVDSTVLERPSVCPHAQLPCVLQDGDTVTCASLVSNQL